MIKFFRKIRQQLLSENKFSKYLFYAIGEIILVVIGILIALQINNWNTQIKERKAEQYYLNQILLELRTNYVSLEKELQNLENQLPHIENLLMVLDRENPEVIEFNSSIKAYINSSLYPIIFETNSATFDEIKSSGRLGLILDKELRNNIVKTYASLERMRKYVDEVNIFGRKMSQDIAIDVGFARYLSYSEPTFGRYNSPENLYSKKQFKKEIMSHIINQNWTIFEFRPIAQKELEGLEKVMKSIEND